MMVLMNSGWKNWKGEELKVLVNYAQRAAIQKTCEIVLEAAKNEVPHDEGTLMRSGMVLMAPDGSPEGCCTFGGGPGTGHPIVPYALRWHEHSANFQKGRKHRYLVDPLNRLGIPTLNKALEMEMRRVL
jgi:hypothetical protein